MSSYRNSVESREIIESGLDLDTSCGSALLWALKLAREHGDPAAALGAAGVTMPEAGQFEGVPEELEGLLGRPASDASIRGALALGILAGRVAYDRRRVRRLQDPTSFLVDPNLVVQAAQGQSIMRLPWFDEGMFIGRQIPDVSEMPTGLRRQCIESCVAALSGDRSQFSFASYGHAYSVDVVPVHEESGGVRAVLAIATPERSFPSAAAAYERTAERLDRSAVLAEQRVQRYRRAGRLDTAVTEQQAADKAREGAERARANALQLRSPEDIAPPDAPSVTPRQAEILDLASHGLRSAEIADQLGVSASTVKTHFDNIYVRLGVSDKAAAVAVALRHGLIA
jgi:DNA-binding CsgD family transcriptional regulator